MGVRFVTMSGQDSGTMMRRLREEVGLSQDELADAIRVAEVADGKPSGARGNYVSQVERGVISPSRARALLIDSILGAGGELARSFGFRVDGAASPSVVDGDFSQRLDAFLRIAQGRSDQITKMLERAGEFDDRLAQVEESAGKATNAVAMMVDEVRRMSEKLDEVSAFLVDWRQTAQ